MWNMFKVNNKNTRTTPIASSRRLYCYLWTYFTPCFSVSIVNSEHVIADSDRRNYMLATNSKQSGYSRKYLSMPLWTSLTDAFWGLEFFETVVESCIRDTFTSRNIESNESNDFFSIIFSNPSSFLITCWSSCSGIFWNFLKINL